MTSNYPRGVQILMPRLQLTLDSNFRFFGGLTLGGPYAIQGGKWASKMSRPARSVHELQFYAKKKGTSLKWFWRKPADTCWTFAGHLLHICWTFATHLLNILFKVFSVKLFFFWLYNLEFKNRFCYNYFI